MYFLEARCCLLTRMLLKVLAVSGALWLGSTTQPAHGAAPWARGDSRAEDLVIRLVTIGPAEPIYTWWGHTALIVEDIRLGEARLYNYGLFSFEQSNFVLDFAMGRLWFQVGAGNVSRELAAYRLENRDVRLQTLNLPTLRRLEMARSLEENIRPENRTYLYDHYSDNCTTRVRDLIDRAVGGQLAAEAAAGRMTLRQHTRRFTSGHHAVDWLLMFLMSGKIDRPITRWQEMFLPAELERNVDRLTYRDESGARWPLVQESVVYYRAEGRRPVTERAPAAWPASLALGIALAALAGLLGARWRRGASGARAAFRAFNALIGLLFGLPGTALFFISLFTDHAVTYGNVNLLLANPLTLAAAGLGIGLASDRERAGRWLAGLWCLLAGMAIVPLVLLALPGSHQQNDQAIAVILPVLLALAAVSVWPGKR
jgi:hypothetical protein